MRNNERKASIKRNTDKTPIGLIALLLAFIAGVVTAFVAVWRIRASKEKKDAVRPDRAADGAGMAEYDSAQADKALLRQLRREYERRESEERSERQQANLDLLSVQTQKIKAYRPRKRVSGKKIFGRAVAVAVAAALVVTGLYLAPVDRVPVPTVQARESFGGIKQVVEEHDAEDPFVILDIVPGKAQVEVNGKTYDFSLGTIGYLAPGQSPIQQDLLRIFKGDEENGTDKDFYDFSAREKLTDSVIGNGGAGSGFAGLTYQEAYEGTGVNLRSGGWSRVFQRVEDPERNEKDDPINVPTGKLLAYVQRRNDDSTGKGYDYDLVPSEAGLFGNTAFKNAGISVPEAGIYTFAENTGDYHVIFSEAAMALSGYRAEVIKSGTFEELVGSYPETTGLYIVENGMFSYAGVIGNHTGTIGPDDPKPEEPKPPIDENNPGEDAENPGEDTGTPGEDTGNPGGDTEPPGEDTGTPGEDTGNPGEDTGNPGGDTGTPGEDTGTPGGDTGNPGEDTGNPGGDTGTPGGDTEEPGGDTDNQGGDQNANQDDQGTPTASVSRMQSVPKEERTGTGWYLCVSTAEEMLLASAGEPGNSGTDPNNPGGEPGNSGTDPNNPGGEPGNSGTDPNNPGGEPGNSGTDPNNPGGEPGNSGTDLNNPGGDTGNPEGDQKEPTPVPQPEMPTEGTYCVLKFTYVETEQEELLYQIKDVKPVSAENVPWDSYILEKASSLNSLNAVREADGLDADTEAKFHFEYVGENKGEFKLIQAGELKKANAADGTDAAQDGELPETETQSGGLSETEAQDAQAADVRAVLDGPCVVEVLNAPVYIQCKGGEDLLRKYVFNSRPGQDNASDDFAIRVDTVLAGDLRPEMIAEADLIYLEDGAGAYFGDDAKKYYIGKQTGDVGDAGNLQNVLEDISAEAIWNLMYTAVEESKPVIVDYGIITNEEDYKNSGYQRLARVFLKRDLDTYYYEFNRSDNFAKNLLMNVDSDKYADKTDNECHYVNRNVYFVNDLLINDFATPLEKDKARAGFTEVLAAIRAENAILPEGADKLSENISKAMAVQYIINYSLGLFGEYKDLSILELQPTANLESDLHYEPSGNKVGGVLVWKRAGSKEAGQSILRSSKEIKASIEVRSVAEFNTSLQDINEDYSMIFIGLDGQRFYRKKDDEGVLKTLYNNPDLIDKVYHLGDWVAGGGATYDANDITVEKKNALLDYLQAGYPIVVENECFQGESAKKAEVKDINTKYIAKGTQMYQFFEEAISMRSKANQTGSEEEGESGIGLYTIEDVHRSAMFVMQLTALRPKIEILGEKKDDGTDAGASDGWNVVPSDQDKEIEVVAYDISNTEEIADKPGFTRGTIRYRIPPNDAGYGWKLAAHLYLDLNYDGVFAKEEEFTGYQHEQTADGGQISVDFNEIGFGFVPWKLEVRVINADNRENEYRRASAQGCFTIKGKEPTKIKVLQILDDTNRDNANLQKQYDGYDVGDDKKDYMLAHFLNGAESLGIEWDIKTVAVDGKNGLKERLKNPNYLSLWDVVVLGFGDSQNPGETVTKAVNEYIAAGGSVLVSSSGASADRLGLSLSDLGQSEQQTYGKLALNSTEKFRYEGILSDMFRKTSGLRVERINESVITKRPYEIEDISSLGDQTEVAMPDYLLDIDGDYHTEEGNRTGRPYTTAWLTLSDTNADRKGGYSTSPRDGRNNYYVYSKGNVVYVGQSEYPYTYESQGGGVPKGAGVDECKIFVNALLAAYSGGVHRADVSIVAGFNGVNKVESVTVPYDVAFKEGEGNTDAKGGILGDTVDVYFRFTDNNIAIDKTAGASFYYKKSGADENATLLSPEGAINTDAYTDFTDTTPIWTVENNRLVEVTDGILVPGKVYRIKAPLEAMQNGDDETSQICVLLKNRYKRAGQDVETFSTDSVSLNRAQMFLLE